MNILNYNLYIYSTNMGNTYRWTDSKVQVPLNIYAERKSNVNLNWPNETCLCIFCSARGIRHQHMTNAITVYFKSCTTTRVAGRKRRLTSFQSSYWRCGWNQENGPGWKLSFQKTALVGSSYKWNMCFLSIISI